MKIKTAVMPMRSSNLKSRLAVMVGAMALLAMPHFAQAQGIIRGGEQGANQGVRDGNRAAGPIGGAVGGAIGLGVGAAVGGVKGVLGIPDRGYGRGRECRGYRDRHGHFRCYR
ncbi:MAG: hypothetical protein JWQ94_3454 [Tardiphaga sp.]|jgi:hypothetical protein|nr:hypothetical protein [Tardiphaga sp.]